MAFIQSIISFFLSFICLIAGHNVAFDPLIEATCKKDGYTNASYCERCGTVLDFEDVIQAKHIYADGKCIFCGKKCDPYEHLLEYIYEHGEVDGECVSLGYYTDSGARYSITYRADKDYIYVSYITEIGDDEDYYVFVRTVIDPSDNVMDIFFSYGPDDDEIQVFGHAKKSTFTAKTPIIVDSYNGPDKYYFEDVEWTREAIVNLLGFLEWYLDEYNVGITLYDLGYKQFVYE